MIINSGALKTLFEGFSTSFNKGFAAAESHYKDVAMVVPSAARETTYGWLGQFPKLREWIGDRVIKNLAAHAYTVVNRTFENTVAVPRTSIEDDQFGVFGPIMEELGKSSGEFPDEMIFSMLSGGFTTPCYDGQYFFDTDHPVGIGAPASVSNMQAGAGEAWYLLDTSRAMKPMLWQERIPFKLTALDREDDENVFMRDEYVYGTRGRTNAGFGLWQLAFASKAALTAANYSAARTAMMSLKGDEGRPLAIRPTVLVVPPSHEEAALKIVNSELGSGGETNPWKGTARLIVTPWLA